MEQVRGRIVAESLLNPTVVDPADTRTEDEVQRLKVSLVKASTTAQRRASVDRLFFAEQARWTKLSPDKPLPSVNPTSEVRLSRSNNCCRQTKSFLNTFLAIRTRFV